MSLLSVTILMKFVSRKRRLKMSDPKNIHKPSLLLRSVDPEHLGLRFIDIGRHQRFDAILRRLRLDFPLITGREIEGQFWWVLTQEQRDEILNFTRRNGLKLLEE